MEEVIKRGAQSEEGRYWIIKSEMKRKRTTDGFSRMEECREEEDCLAQRRKGAKEAVRMLQLFPPLFWAGGFG